MSIDRRDLLKALSTTTLAAALEGVWGEEALPQANAATQAGQRAEISKSPVERAPERLLQAEPVVTLEPGGEATIEWETVIPTQGGTLYVGLPNDEVALDWPIYNASQPITEGSARLKHAAQIDVRGFATRSAARMLFEGGTLAYRLELFDTRKGVAICSESVIPIQPTGSVGACMGASPVLGWMSCARAGNTRATGRPWPARSSISKRSRSSIRRVKNSLPRCEARVPN